MENEWLWYSLVIRAVAGWPALPPGYIYLVTSGITSWATGSLTHVICPSDSWAGLGHCNLSLKGWISSTGALNPEGSLQLPLPVWKVKHQPQNHENNTTGCCRRLTERRCYPSSLGFLAPGVLRQSRIKRIITAVLARSSSGCRLCHRCARAACRRRAVLQASLPSCTAQPNWGQEGRLLSALTQSGCDKCVD